jgi:ABC-type dipeptide/oligopeptide/nickel transport system permease subunit
MVLEEYVTNLFQLFLVTKISLLSVLFLSVFSFAGGILLGLLAGVDLKSR